MQRDDDTTDPTVSLERRMLDAERRAREIAENAQAEAEAAREEAVLAREEAERAYRLETQARVRLQVLTDGVTDERRDADEFGETRLHEALSELTGADAQRIADGVVDAVVGFRTGQPKDDIAILAIKVVG